MKNLVKLSANAPWKVSRESLEMLLGLDKLWQFLSREFPTLGKYCEGCERKHAR